MAPDDNIRHRRQSRHVAVRGRLTIDARLLLTDRARHATTDDAMPPFAIRPYFARHGAAAAGARPPLMPYACPATYDFLFYMYLQPYMFIYDDRLIDIYTYMFICDVRCRPAP